jgi:hypothetical protein
MGQTVYFINITLTHSEKREGKNETEYAPIIIRNLCRRFDFAGTRSGG